MTVNMAGAIAAVVAVLVFTAGMILTLKYTHLSRKVKFREKAMQQGCVAFGVCHKKRTKRRVSENSSGTEEYRYTIIIKYKYTVEGVDYFRKVKYHHDSYYRNDSFSDPMNVHILYDRNNPKKAYAESEVSDDQVRTEGTLLTVILTLLLGLGTFFGLVALFVKDVDLIQK